jgi:arylsulfatase A-like enzyme
MSPTKRRPNIILCMCDQLRAFETGAYGHPTIRTPNIDRLAAEGVRVETAVSSYPVCMAARSVTLSGQYNRRCTGGISNVGGWDDQGHLWMPQYPDSGRPHLKDPTLAEVLRQDGYHTAVIGKWHIHSWPQDIGFDQYLIPRVHHCHSGQHYTENGGPEFVPPGFSLDFETARVEQFLQDRRGQEEPFFLFFNISPPHCPLSDAPERYLAMYDPREIPLRPNVDEWQTLPDQDHWFKIYRWDFRYYNFRLPYTQDLPADYTLRRVIAEYYGLTSWVDATVGRMMAALRANGLDEDTLVVFTSDHGDYLGSHGRVQKGDVHEESVRVPLLFRWPNGLPPGVVDQQVAGLVDIFPSLAELAGLAVPTHVQGHSLAPVLRGERAALDAAFAIIETGSGPAVRTPDALYKLPFETGTRRLADRPEFFFDQQADPYQMRNLASGMEQVDTAARLDALLRAWDAATPWMNL